MVAHADNGVYDYDEMVVMVECRCCHNHNLIPVDRNDFMRWKNGALIQNALGYLSVDERELLISQTCPGCWDRMFGGDEA